MLRCPPWTSRVNISKIPAVPALEVLSQPLRCSNCFNFQDLFLCEALSNLEHLRHLSLGGSTRLTDALLAGLTGGLAPNVPPRVAEELEVLDLSQKLSRRISMSLYYLMIFDAICKLVCAIAPIVEEQHFFT